MRAFSSFHVSNSSHKVINVSSNGILRKQLCTNSPKSKIASSLPTAKNISSETLHEGKFLKLSKLTYTIGDKKGVWEVAQRTSCKGEVDAVAILAIVKNKNQPDKVIITKQYRPPVGRVCVELPAGLVDAQEAVEETAIRELKEETGYEGTVLDSSIELAIDPGLSSSNTKIVVVEVNADRPVNRNPQQQLEENENIEIELVEVPKLLPALFEYKKQGLAVEAKLFSFAFGMHVASPTTTEQAS